MSALRVGLLGLGVVGSGTFKVLNSNAAEITRRTGRQIEVVAVAVRDVDKARELVGDSIPVTQNGLELVQRADVDVVVELIGGDTVAYEWVMAAIANGKHVVTANKALLATRGNEIFEAAREQGVMVAYEAAVAGGIPIIKAMREGLAANKIEWVAGIINGTTNYILSEMRNAQLAFSEALYEAQRLGFAEADPTFDIEGVDAAHKLALLASLAFGIPVQFDKIYTEGISTVAREDLQHADRLGYRIKLLGIARRTPNGIELRVHPTLIPAEQPLANIEGAMNAVLVQGDMVGPTMYYGQGAGELPTASAVVADLIDVARLQTVKQQHQVPALAFQADALIDIPILPMTDVVSSYYLRLRVEDRPGVLADIARILADSQISVDSMFQEPHGEEQSDIIFLTHRAVEGHVNKALEQVQALELVKSKITRIRVESLS
ncbi:MAG TPA: homoserine dehydrogenase [Burkholderiaceae bacterium]|nr:homoserine dehydrogenase [Burkholderiaceae bacterium]